MLTRFRTGATGYIGGSILDALVRRHPEYDVSVLVRGERDMIRRTYSNVGVVKGNFENFEVLSSAAASSDIVVHAGDSDHEDAVKALISGLLRRPATSSPGYFIHLSGTGILIDWKKTLDQQGDNDDKVWSDVSDLSTIKAFDDYRIHRKTEKILFATASEYADRLRIAIVSPPDIYGRGKGPGRKESVYMPVFLHESRRFGLPFHVGSGCARRSWVHIDELTELYLQLVESAFHDGIGAEWNSDGYYFAATQEVSQLEVARAVAEVMAKQGWVESAQTKSITIADTDNMMAEYSYYNVPLARNLFAESCRSRSDRAARCFAYGKMAPTLLESLDEEVFRIRKR